MPDWLSRIDATHELLWTGSGSGGSWTYRISRDGGGYRVTEVLENDSDPLGPASPVTRTKLLDASATSGDIAEQIRRSGDPSVVKR